MAGFALGDEEYQFVEELLPDVTTTQWALIQFEVPMTSPVELSLIAARLGGESDAQHCRMALHGKILQTIDPAQREQLKIYKASFACHNSDRRICVLTAEATTRDDKGRYG